MAAVFNKTTLIGKTERSRKVGINETASFGYDDSTERAGYAGFNDGTQDANSPDGDGFNRFTEFESERDEA